MAMLVSSALSFVGTKAQEPPRSSLEDLKERLENARSELSRIQAQAESVEDQVESLDDQIAAVRRALALSRQLVERTQIDIGTLEDRIADREMQYQRVQVRVEIMAIELYKSGGTDQIEVLLSSTDIRELSERVAFAQRFSDAQEEILVRAIRLKGALEADKSVLEEKLAEALKARNEQVAQAQHLHDLRSAQASKLADLRRRIESQREEADAIAARSADIERQLAAIAPSSPHAHPEPAAPAPGTTPLTSGAAGFTWPLNGPITSGFGPRWGRMHSGIDIDGVTGDSIRASKGGRVVGASYDSSGYGYHVVINHGGGFASLYAHASRLYVSAGENVSQGETIAAVGNTGASTGDHLHFEIRVNGSPQDPLVYLP
jgi:murein DD-endopeptidase MepM/ murein hydrolase activator NlpD